MDDRFTKYIGIPFRYNGRDLNSLDCYGLVMLLYKQLHNIDIPDVISPEFMKEIAALADTQKPLWKASEIKEGAVLLFSIGGYGSHVAYVIGPDTMIHTWEKTNGVTIERISRGWEQRIIGCYTYENQD